MIEILQKFLPKIQKVITSELRVAGSTRFVETTYITSYDIVSEISTKIEILTTKSVLFRIEYKGNTIIYTTSYPTDETLMNFLYIIEEIINFDRRLIRMKKLFS
jgi:hypothetical protein